MYKVTIEKLKTSKECLEAEAYTNGEFQAKKLLSDDPDYKLLCELHDMGESFDAGGDDIDANRVYDLDKYPAALRYHLLKGFFDTVTAITKELRDACISRGLIEAT